jgi:hypothetical protein
MKKFFYLFIILTLLAVPCLTHAGLQVRQDPAAAKAYIERTDLAELFTRKNEDYPFELVLPDWVRESLTEMEIYEEIYKKVGIDLKEEVKLGRLFVKDGKYYINFREKKIEKEIIRRQERLYGFNLKSISLEDAYKIDGLNLEGFGLKEPHGLQYLINVNTINLSQNKEIKDYRFLSNFTKIKSIFLNENNIVNISFLANININLTDISLKNNSIIDISILDRFKHLRILLLSNNQITSLKGLANLEKIEYLYVNGNPITLDGLKYISELCYGKMLIELHIDRKVFKEYGTKFALYPEFLQWVDRIYFVEDDGNVTKWYNY